MHKKNCLIFRKKRQQIQSESTLYEGAIDRKNDQGA